jgi:hypothetical protein
MLRIRRPVFSDCHPLPWYLVHYSGGHDGSSPRGAESQRSCLGNAWANVWLVYFSRSTRRWSGQVYILLAVNAEAHCTPEVDIGFPRWST